VSTQIYCRNISKNISRTLVKSQDIKESNLNKSLRFLNSWESVSYAFLLPIGIGVPQRWKWLDEQRNSGVPGISGRCGGCSVAPAVRQVASGKWQVASGKLASASWSATFATVGRGSRHVLRLRAFLSHRSIDFFQSCLFLRFEIPR